MAPAAPAGSGGLGSGALREVALRGGRGDPHRRAALQVAVPRHISRRSGRGRRGRRCRRGPLALESAHGKAGDGRRASGTADRRPARRRRLRCRGLEPAAHRQPGHSHRTRRSRSRNRSVTWSGNRRRCSTGDGTPRTGTRTSVRIPFRVCVRVRIRVVCRLGLRLGPGLVPRRPRRVLRVPGRRRVIDGELARHLAGGLRVGLVIAGRGPAPADPVRIAVHNSSWCGRAPSCRAGRPFLVCIRLVRSRHFVGGAHVVRRRAVEVVRSARLSPGTPAPGPRVPASRRSQPNHHDPCPGRPVHPPVTVHYVTA